MRIPLQYGGDPALTRLFLVCNDTGSDVLTVFRSDLAMLQFDPARHGGALQGSQLLDTPIGFVPGTFLEVEMQVLTSSLVELTPCFVEMAVIKADSMGAARLSGQRMRQYLFFGTAPGNDRLYVAQEKAGLIRDMPA